jgi:hypothetical protein
MTVSSQLTRYNQPIPHMHVRWSGSLRIGWRAAVVFTAIIFISGALPPRASASVLGDSARQLAQKIASATGSGAVSLEIANRSSLDDKSVRDVRSALEADLRTRGVRTAKAEEAMGSVQVTLSESVREYVWTAEIAIGADVRRVVLVAAPRPSNSTGLSQAMGLVVRKSFLIAQEQPILDAALLEMSGGPRLLVLDANQVAIFHQQNGRWERETTLTITHSHIFPRDLRGRLLLRRDHLFDVYLPGTFCRSNVTAPLALTCADRDNPWPFTFEDSGVSAFFAPARNFFTGTFSPAIGKVSNGPSFYSAAALAHSGYTLWILAGVDGSIHMLDGMTDQLIPVKWGSDLAAVHSSCGTGTQLLVSESGDAPQDSLRAVEILDREPVVASAPVEFEGAIVVLWTEAGGNDAIAIVKKEDTGWYEAYRISIACGS